MNTETMFRDLIAKYKMVESATARDYRVDYDFPHVTGELFWGVDLYKRMLLNIPIVISFSPEYQMKHSVPVSTIRFSTIVYYQKYNDGTAKFLLASATTFLKDYDLFGTDGTDLSNLETLLKGGAVELTEDRVLHPAVFITILLDRTAAGVENWNFDDETITTLTKKTTPSAASATPTRKIRPGLGKALGAVVGGVFGCAVVACVVGKVIKHTA